MTPHFAFHELVKTDTNLPNRPPFLVESNLKVLALGLEMVRLIVGRAVRVHSAYRSPEVNAAVGGTATSDHPDGYCADISVEGYTAKALAWALVGKLPYDQLILETSRGVVHISFDPRLRMQAKTQRGVAGSPMVDGIV